MAAIHRKKIMAVVMAVVESIRYDVVPSAHIIDPFHAPFYKDSTYTVKDPFQVSTKITVIKARFCTLLSNHRSTVSDRFSL